MNNKIQNFVMKVAILGIGIFSFILFEKNRETIGLLLTKGVDYIMGCPFGIKQSFVVKTTLGNVFIQLISPAYVYDIIFSTRVCCFITFEVYKYTFMTLKEILHLLNNRTYNPVMKRFDSIYLNIDQIVLSVLIFSILAIFLFNLVLFYIYFVILYFLVELGYVLQLILIEIVFSDSSTSVFELFLSGFQKSIFNRNFFYRVLYGELISLSDNDLNKFN